ncbi:acidobacterial duplicated orphan (ADOP) ABC-type permease-like protein [Psychroflexus torquis ATCC 700755]|uniref:Acidobacterial duplicated orphan (ADOP) ABC-type permease-like protein n=1 Tax=Psychroflexus torquis (strain ATCC 700755 / CIP 106069 / ACAM 623) TaxID=313595 RepID=K4IMP2_PSYTT|nr:FtsX-like permease family protein [Psychroflexus torquis]AFU70336.1 acidobacterial duplicated orphan (ADOP) ABC-type permease-like protein [Psychroflexus torquis ATCC 700755]
MFKNYFKIAFRNLWRHKSYSAINIGGLAVGMTAGFLLLLYIGYEMSYESFHSNKDQLYRVVTDIETPSNTYKTPVVDWNILSEITAEFPEIENNTRLNDTEFDVRLDNNNYHESKVLGVDESFFQIFDYELLQGNPIEALKTPFSLVLSETTAKKYFGDENALGKTLKIMDDNRIATVTGVMKDNPKNTQIKSDILISMSTYTEVLDPDLKESWGDFTNRGFVLLNKNVNPKALEAKIASYNERAHGEIMKEAELKLTYFLEPIEDIYLYSERGSSPQIGNVYIFLIVALFILLIAAINFINLTTARSVERAKEVGIRKVIGAKKGQLSIQFLSESIVICLFAFLLAIGFTWLALPYFNTLAGKEIASSIWDRPIYPISLFGMALLIALVAGSYPALVLSSFKPIKVLKGKLSSSSSGSKLRKGLVISQFTISVIMIVSTIIVYNQIDYMRSQDLGFDMNQVMIVETDGSAKQKIMIDELSNIPNIISITTAATVPGGGGDNSTALTKIVNQQGNEQTLTIDRYRIDDDYINQFDLKLLAGRNFSKDLASDSLESMIINEKAFGLLGYSDPEQIIGKGFDQWGRKGKIIGVVKDFHMTSLKEEIVPLSMVYNSSGNTLINLKMTGNDVSATIAIIENSFKKAYPNTTFEYAFVNELFKEQYEAERRFGTLFLSFALLAIFISCLGLLGLASYSTLQRRREIGIRKVLGASSMGIVNLLSKDFLKLVLISIVIATPISWFIMNKWLQDFAYRMDISWWIFAVSGGLALGIAFLTVSFQAIKAAMTNPVNSLKTE